jgi:hypothetical protein
MTNFITKTLALSALLPIIFVASTHSNIQAKLQENAHTLAELNEGSLIYVRAQDNNTDISEDLNNLGSDIKESVKSGWQDTKDSVSNGWNEFTGNVK